VLTNCSCQKWYIETTGNRYSSSVTLLAVDYSGLGEQCTPSDTFHRLCTEMFTHYPDYTVVFTDGSVANRLTGFALILNGKLFKFQLNIFCSVFTAELLASCKALGTVYNLPLGKVLLCMDSLSTVQALYSPDITYTLI
jgi:hypothetical protein